MSLMSDEFFQPVGPFKTLEEARADLAKLRAAQAGDEPAPPAKVATKGKQLEKAAPKAKRRKSHVATK